MESTSWLMATCRPPFSLAERGSEVCPTWPYLKQPGNLLVEKLSTDCSALVLAVSNPSHKDHETNLHETTYKGFLNHTVCEGLLTAPPAAAKQRVSLGNQTIRLWIRMGSTNAVVFWCVSRLACAFPRVV